MKRWPWKRRMPVRAVREYPGGPPSHSTKNSFTRSRPRFRWNSWKSGFSSPSPAMES